MQRIEIEDKMIFAFMAGKNNMDEIEFRNQLNEWLDKKFPGLVVK